MATKRPIKVNPQVKQETVEPQEESWSDWLQKSYARYWYLVLCLFIDSMIALEILRHEELSFRYGLVGAVMLLVVLLEYFVYRQLWGRHGRWSASDDDDQD
jgi:hypothetical protein